MWYIDEKTGKGLVQVVAEKMNELVNIQKCRSLLAIVLVFTSWKYCILQYIQLNLYYKILR
jgi:hypothetical protein